MSSYVLFTNARRRARFYALITELAAKVGRAIERRRAADALSHMSDHQLRDIGINRSEILHTVEKGRRDY